jgi:hypothetical protein
MCKLFTKYFLSLFFTCSVLSLSSFAQNSILVNLGSATCSNPLAPTFSLTRNPLDSTSSILTLCDLSQQLPDYFNAFIAYNPKDNKIYIDDVRLGDSSKVWVLDAGLPGNITCPASIPLTPTYEYSFVPNNFEFDNNGNLWSFSNYDPTTGLCTMNNFDVTNGNSLFTKQLQFPISILPNTLSSGDVTILPNGRMFVVFGNFPSQLYEVTNYNASTDTATATFLQTMPQNTYGLAYLNGLLEITGTDEVSSCYYYTYDFSNNILSAPQAFQNGQSPIDNTSITPTVGVTKQLVTATKVNDNTADLTYYVYVRNMGNVLLNNINVSDDLATAYGAVNVSNVTTSFVAGQNNANLTLNASYNGVTDTFLLSPGQVLPNLISNDSNYFFKLQINCRVTNLNTTTTYLNSAIGSASIGSGLSLIDVSDSSNNGTPDVVDPNNNDNPGDPGENVPTPFNFANIVPVHFVNATAALANSSTSIIKWTVATPTTNASAFEIEYSKDGISWAMLAQVNVVNTNQANYQYQQQNIPSGNLYYRIKEIDDNGYATYSRVVSLNNNKNGGYVIFPNPANNYIEVSAPYGISGNSEIELFDAIGRKLIDNTITTSTAELNTTHLPNGTYLLRIKNSETITTQKVLIAH